METKKRFLNMEKWFAPLLFLFSLDAWNLSGLLLTLTLVLFFALFWNEIRLDRLALVLLVFSAGYTLSVFYYEGLTLDGVVKYAIAPWGSYVLGYNYLRLNEKASVTRLAELLLTGFFLHGALNLAASVQRFGLNFNHAFRLAFDFWQGRTISVTTAALYYSPLTVLALGWLFTEKSRWKRALAVLILGAGLFATMLYQNRTLPVVLLLVGAAGLGGFFLDRTVPAGRKRRLAGGGAAVLGVLLLLWLTDLGGLRTWLQGTALYARMTGATGERGSRLAIWISFLRGSAWKYPFGGNQIALYNDSHYAHNCWLDIYRRTGVVPFLTAAAFTLAAAGTTRRFARRYRTDGRENGRLLGLTLLGILLIFSAEPVMEANPYVFYIPLLLVGAMRGRLAGLPRGEEAPL